MANTVQEITTKTTTTLTHFINGNGHLQAVDFSGWAVEEIWQAAERQATVAGWTLEPLNAPYGTRRARRTYAQWVSFFARAGFATYPDRVPTGRN